MKKLFLGLGSVMAITLPVIVVVSCDTDKTNTSSKKTVEDTKEPDKFVNFKGEVHAEEIDSKSHTLYIQNFYYHRDNGDGDVTSSISTQIIKDATKEEYKSFGIEKEWKDGKKYVNKQKKI